MAVVEDHLWRRSSPVNGSFIFQLQQEGADGNDTEQKLSALIFADSHSVRTGTIVLATFNLIAAIALASSILYDCFRASKRSNRALDTIKHWISAIHSAETVPLILAVGIVIQSVVFIGAQSTGLSSLFIDGCATTSVYVFPAIFVVPYIQVVFGIECASRGLRRTPFPARGKYDVTICLVVIVLMLIATWIPAQLRQEMDHCFGSLMWFVTRRGRSGLSILSSVAGLSMASAIMIFYRLVNNVTINQRERIAASRMVYYLVLGVVSLTFVIPWFVTLTIKKPTITTSMMATVVSNLNGILIALIQLFLRSNIAAASLGPKGARRWSSGKHEFRLFGPNELGFDEHMLRPVSGPQRPDTNASRRSLIESEKARPSEDSLRSPPVMSKLPTFKKSTTEAAEVGAKLPEMSEPKAVKLSPTRGHRRNQSYSLFPITLYVSSPEGKQEKLAAGSKWRGSGSRVRDTVASLFSSHSSKSRDTLVSKSGADDFLEPPPPLHFIDGTNRHRRDSSMQSSATVQIGLRLSNVVYNPEIEAAPGNRPTSPRLRVDTKNLTIDLRSPKPSPLHQNVVESPPLSKEVRDARMKTLPPIPRESTISRSSAVAAPMIQLSPTVYTPQPKLGLPHSPSPKFKLMSPLRIGHKLEDKSKSRPRGSKASWI